MFHPPQEAEQVAKQHGYNLRPTKARDYTHLGHTQFVAEPTRTYLKLVTKLFSLAQMSFKMGLRQHGMEAGRAMLKAFAQIKEKEVFSPIKASSLAPTQRRKALRTINLIKEKQGVPASMAGRKGHTLQKRTHRHRQCSSTHPQRYSQ